MSRNLKIWGVVSFISERVLSCVSRFSQYNWCFCFGHRNILWKWVMYLCMTNIFQYKHGLRSCMRLYGINQNPPAQINDIYDGNWYTTLFLIARLGSNIISRRLLLNDKFTLPMLYIDTTFHPYLHPIGEEFWSWRFYRYTTCILQTSQCDQTDGCRVAPTAFIVARFVTKKPFKLITNKNVMIIVIFKHVSVGLIRFIATIISQQLSIPKASIERIICVSCVSMFSYVYNALSINITTNGKYLFINWTHSYVKIQHSITHTSQTVKLDKTLDTPVEDIRQWVGSSSTGWQCIRHWGII